VTKQNVDAFLGSLADTPELWRSMHIRVVAIWAKDAWQNLITSVLLDQRPPENVPLADDLPKLDRITAIQEVLPIEALPRLLQRLRVRGTLPISGTTVQFLTAGYGEPFSKPYDSSYHRRGLSLDDYVPGDFQRGHALVLFGDNGAELSREFPGDQSGIDVALRLAGWQSLNELALRAFGEVMAPPYTSARRITFIAPLKVALVDGSCELSEGALSYAVSAGSREAGGKAAISVTGEDKTGKRIFRLLPLADKRWKKQGERVVHSGKVRLANARKVEITLHMAGYQLGSATVTGQGKRPDRPPLMMLAHDALFTGQRPFQDVLLAPKNSEGRPFERAVAKLFAYCGFPTDQPGQIPAEQNGPDVLVEVPGRNLLLVIETTVKHLMNDEDGKMNRLTKRSADIRFAVKHLDVEVVPLMVVPWPRETLVPVELEEAVKNGVQVLGNEDLAHLLSMALSHTPREQIANYLVPEPPKPRRKGLSQLVERNPLAD
jgi:hypothetical protein